MERIQCICTPYGVTNVTRDVALNSFGSKLNTVFDNGTWWSKATPNADVVVPRWNSTPSYNDGTQFYMTAPIFV